MSNFLFFFFFLLHLQVAEKEQKGLALLSLKAAVQLRPSSSPPFCLRVTLKEEKKLSVN
jgi:hypothetical protein